MAKKKSLVYYCTECGTESAKWQGQCPGCGAWNTMEEAPVTKTSTGKEKVIMPSELAKPTKMREIETENTPRLQTGIQELDRVLGGGIVAGSLVLVGGDPGIGKSTLLLQVCRNLAEHKVKVLYISGEESKAQLKLRAKRLGVAGSSLMVAPYTDIGQVVNAITAEKPDMVMVDSIQTMNCATIASSSGSVTQVKRTQLVIQIMRQSAR